MADTECSGDEHSDTTPVELNENELYTIDICPTKKYVIFGGKGDSAEVYSYGDERVVTRVDEFDDSVIYTKFISDSRFIIVTNNGTIALMEYESDVCIIDIEEDVTAVVFNGKLVVGTLSGKVHLYDAELEHINTFGGHTSEILSVDYQEGRILSMSATHLTANDEHGRELYTLKTGEAYAFKYIASDVICLARDGKIQVMKQKNRLFEYAMQERVESIELVSKSLVIGGEFENIILIDTTGHYGVFKLKVKAEVTMIKKADEYRIVFATAMGMIGSVDIRDISTLKYHSSGVGVVFDFCVSWPDVGVVGEDGFAMINMETDEPIETDLSS